METDDIPYDGYEVKYLNKPNHPTDELKVNKINKTISTNKIKIPTSKSKLVRAPIKWVL